MTFKVQRPGKIIEKSIRLQDYAIDWNGPTRSKFQTRIKMFLYPYWHLHLCYEELRVVGSRMTFDLFNLTRRLAVECQGRQHTETVSFFHGKGIAGFSAFKDQLDRDIRKEEFCRLNNITLVEIYEKDELTEKRARELKLI